MRASPRRRGGDVVVSIRIVVADDHPFVRSGIRALVDALPDMSVVAEAGDVAETVAAVRAAAPDVVVLDLDMPGAVGMSGLDAVRAADPRVRIVVLSMHAGVRHVRDAHAHGAVGYVPKSAADADLADAVRHVAAGGTYVHPSLGALLAVTPEDARDLGDSALTPRQRQVAAMLAAGHTNQEIGRALGISVRTVEAHRGHVMQRLGVGTRSELVRMARRHGMFEDDGGR